ncbi:MAG: hypothetical protein ACXABY_33380 [Candidatus Thorarchaeota archaeon]|jgi:hypothetical protein
MTKRGITVIGNGNTTQVLKDWDDESITFQVGGQERLKITPTQFCIDGKPLVLASEHLHNILVYQALRQWLSD